MGGKPPFAPAAWQLRRTREAVIQERRGVRHLLERQPLDLQADKPPLSIPMFSKSEIKSAADPYERQQRYAADDQHSQLDFCPNTEINKRQLQFFAINGKHQAKGSVCDQRYQRIPRSAGKVPISQNGVGQLHADERDDAYSAPR